MKVNPADVARVLTLTPAAITMAVKRNNLNKTLDGLIDLEDTVNYSWVHKRLLKLCKKQGCEVPEINFLFKATPITEDEKDKQNNSGIKNNNISDNQNVNEQQEETDRKKLSKEITDIQRRLDAAKTSDYENKAELSRLKVLEQKRDLIQINPLGRLLFSIVGASRIKELNVMPNLSQKILDDIKSALIEREKEDIPQEDKVSDIELRVMMQGYWKDELSKIFKSTDLELKSKIRQYKKIIENPDENKEEIDSDYS